MYLDDIVSAQKRGEVKGIPSICSAHPWVLREAVRRKPEHLLIEATCNQVNQFGGYTGMTPADFVLYVQRLAAENQCPFDRIILGGDHLGPNVWRANPAESAMETSAVLVRDYVHAGFMKIHLDCSMKLGDDAEGPLDVELAAARTAKLAKVAESSIMNDNQLPRYVIGTEVPVPGGLSDHDESFKVTTVEDANTTIAVMQRAFYKVGLQSAWERVVGVVVQPGVEFGDDFIMDYDPRLSAELSKFIESKSMVYEAHSTDYQRRDSLKALVKDHFAILKVGPALTFAFRQAIFALAFIENELSPMGKTSNILQVLDQEMLNRPEVWGKYHAQDQGALAYKRKYSLSDRLRYFWTSDLVKNTIDVLLYNLNRDSIPLSLISQFAPIQYTKIRAKEIDRSPEAIIRDHIQSVLLDYEEACE